MAPNNPHYFVANKQHCCNFNTSRCQESVQYCGSEINFVWVFLGFSPNLSQIELRHSLARPRLAALYFIKSLSRRIPSLWRNDSMYLSLSVGIRTQLGYPLASRLSFRNVLIYFTKSPPSPVSLLYCVTLYSYTSSISKIL